MQKPSHWAEDEGRSEEGTCRRHEGNVLTVPSKGSSFGSVIVADPSVGGTIIVANQITLKGLGVVHKLEWKCCHHPMASV